MLTTNLEKVNKFYLVLIAILILLAVMVIFSFRGVFSAYLTAYEIDQESFGNNTKVDKEKLEESYSWAFTKETLPLEIR